MEMLPFREIMQGGGDAYLTRDEIIRDAYFLEPSACLPVSPPPTINTHQGRGGSGLGRSGAAPDCDSWGGRGMTAQERCGE